MHSYLKFFPRSLKLLQDLGLKIFSLERVTKQGECLPCPTTQSLFISLSTGNREMCITPVQKPLQSKLVTIKPLELSKFSYETFLNPQDPPLRTYPKSGFEKKNRRCRRSVRLARCGKLRKADEYSCWLITLKDFSDRLLSQVLLL